MSSSSQSSSGEIPDASERDQPNGCSAAGLLRWRLRGYGCAVVLPALASFLWVLFSPLLGDRNHLVVFYPAVMVSAWLGGLWPGLAATIMSALIADFVFLEPVGFPRIARPGDHVALALFVAIGAVISVLNEHLHRVAARERAARDEAERARTEADAANRTKDLFLGAVSHDLRAPLTAVLGSVDMLSRRMLDEEQQQRAFDRIRRNLHRQLLLVNDLLDTAAILSGQLRIERGIVCAQTMVQGAVDVVRPIADRKGVRSTVDGDEAAPIRGDSLRLQQVLCNLLTNAVKFTPQGGAVGLHVERDGDHIELRVTDSGAGFERTRCRFCSTHSGRTTGGRGPIAAS